MKNPRQIFENALNKYQGEYTTAQKGAVDAYNDGKTAMYHKYHREAIKAQAARDALEECAKACDLVIRFNAITNVYTVELQ